jgi:hypothetical protein
MWERHKDWRLTQAYWNNFKYKGKRFYGEIIRSWKKHEWLDYAWPRPWQKIACYSCFSWEVTYAGWKKWFGYCVYVSNGEYETVHAHLTSYTVKTWDQVRAMQKLGIIGNSWSWTGVHLHLGLRPLWKWRIDPTPYICEWDSSVLPVTPPKEEDERDDLVLEAMEKRYYNGVEWWWLTNRTVLFVMKALEWESRDEKESLNSVVQSDVILDYSEIEDGADEDWSYVTVNERMSLQEMKKFFPRCKTNYYRRIQKNKRLQLSQDEFESKSNRCTLYANLASMTHRWIDTTASQRKKLYAWYKKKWFYKNGWGASTIEISKLWWQALKETGVYKWKVETYVFKTWSFELNWLLLYHNLFVVTSTVLSLDFAKDRTDDWYLNGEVHGGKVYWWHAHWWCAIHPNLLLWTNSYGKRKNNHTFMNKKQMLQYNSEKRTMTKKFVRTYSAIHIYS